MTIYRQAGRTVMVAGLSLLLTVAACTERSNEKATIDGGGAARVVAKVGERSITLADLDREMKNYRSLLSVRGGGAEQAKISRLRQGLLGRLVNHVILETEADAEGITVSQDDLESEIRALLGNYDEARVGLVLAENGLTMDEWKQALTRRIKIRKLTVKAVDASVQVEEPEIRAYFRDNQDDFRWPERVHAEQIMTVDETTAEQVRRKLLAGGDFAELARAFSKSPEAASGGDLGYFSAGQLPPDLEEAVFALKPGAISEVINSIYGFHIFRQVDREKPRAMTFEEAKERVRAILTARKREEEFSRWVESLSRKYETSVFPEVLSAPYAP